MFHCFILIFLHCPLSGHFLTYISLLIIPCMIVYVTNNKEPWTLYIAIVRHCCNKLTKTLCISLKHLYSPFEPIRLSNYEKYWFWIDSWLINLMSTNCINQATPVNREKHKCRVRSLDFISHSYIKQFEFWGLSSCHCTQMLQSLFSCTSRIVVITQVTISRMCGRFGMCQGHETGEYLNN